MDVRASVRSYSDRQLQQTQCGRLVAQVLKGSWRQPPPPLLISAAQLASIATLLLGSGAGGLSWRRARYSSLSRSPAAHSLQQSWRLHALQDALHARSLKLIVLLFRSAGIEPILVKGWSIARLYPEPGLRPYGDFDLCVEPAQYQRAQAVLRSPEGRSCNVDLHSGFGKFYDQQTEAFLARSQLVNLDDLAVRVLAAEDHLRFLCVHLLRHGAVRPLWLCDVAMMLESLPTDFNWDQCLGTSRKQADWVACVIGLAHQLLGAEVGGTPVRHRARTLPRWLIPTVLKAWSTPFQMPAPLTYHLSHLSGFIRELPRHWPNPLEATMTVQGAFNELPRLPFQVAHLVSRTTALVKQLMGVAN